MGFSFATVTGTDDLTPHIRRVHLHVEHLARLQLPGGPDDAVGLYFPELGRSRPPAMELRDEVWGYHDLDEPPEGRNYTIRSVDHRTATVDVDFVIHSRGPATLWAQRADVGDAVAMSHARGWYRPASGTDWLLLGTDLAGLPAAARILDELATDPRPVTLVVEVIDEDDLAYLGHLADGVEVISLIGSGNGISASRLGTTIAALDVPAGIGYCWFAGEAAESRTVRKHFRREHHWPADRYDIIGYWRYDGEAWARRYAEHGDELLAVYQQAIADGKGEKRAAEEFDEALEQAGL
ncbi:siderophore-interacting protein [Gordonia polyisoprenivorans]|uniref:siderophore-interacting protein n=1 Tax=Gordonia polyisoprenivorans TaxID=84595 RepID=UPI0003691566|nr:siderophore-interacting protein [Gordonia polyisoprenivorans]QUD83260.1 siderophore-interacting protein [Gordonia polyisoprenivorans]WCB36978.1 siderophore-interacting protein [Gordonia polyisoprenivorans]